MWVARDKDGALYLYDKKPKRLKPTNGDLESEHWDCGLHQRIKLDKDKFPEQKWENMPLEVTIIDIYNQASNLIYRHWWDDFSKMFEDYIKRKYKDGYVLDCGSNYDVYMKVLTDLMKEK